MKKIHLGILLILLFLPIFFGVYGLYKTKATVSQETMNISIVDTSSTKAWQDTTWIYLNKRNELINNVLDGKYDTNRKWILQLKQIECAPLLDGDISLMEYMSKNRGQFINRISNIKVEYNVIRQLTKDEVIMTAKISHVENNIKTSYNYEVIFKNVNGKWYLSKFAFTE